MTTFSRLHHLFEASFAATPNRIAVIQAETQLTYAHLEASANRLAHFLRAQGIGPGDRVGILLERSRFTYLALLATLKAGAAFVPIDPSFPAERIAFITADAAVKATLTITSFRSRLAEWPCLTIALDQLEDDPNYAALPTTRPPLAPDPPLDDLCYIIYTSGTTGRPKGVAVEQRHICNFFREILPIYGVTANDRVYQGMIVAFDFSMEEIWPAFAAGATLVAGPTDSDRFGSGLTRFLMEQRITVFCCVPTLLATLDRDVPSLRLLMVGGEACPQDLVTRWSTPGRRMLNTYGPTETTITSTWTELKPGRMVSIGRPLPTYTVHLLNDALQPVESGAIGEIHIGGQGVSRGYVNRPDLTLEKFIPDPFSPEAGSRLYKTGDLGRLLENGEIEYLGRIDTQVKIRGYRIELAEIESLLLETAEVEIAVVAPWPRVGELQDLVGYIKPRTNSLPPGLSELHAKLSRKLPGYMVPAYLELIPEVPTLANGKIDRSRLPAPEGPRLSLARGEYIAPSTPLEKKIAGMWSTIFKQEHISVDANFFTDLGGHSLFAAQMVSTLRQYPPLQNLSIGDLYIHPTIRKLATYGEALHHQPVKPPLATAEPEERWQSPFWRCGLSQGVTLYFLFAILSVPPLAMLRWLAPVLRANHLIVYTLLLLLGSAMLLIFTGLALPLAVKRLIIGSFEPGDYPLWGKTYFRWWLFRKIQQLAPLQYLAGTPLMSPYCRLLGAKIGRDCYLGTPQLHLFDMLEIGDQVSIGYGSQIYGYTIEGGRLHIGPVRIGNGCYVGLNSVILPDTTMDPESRLGDQSLLSGGHTIPAAESWCGSPAAPAEQPDPAVDRLAKQILPESGRANRGELLAGFASGVLLFTLIPALAVLPGSLVILKLQQRFHGYAGLYATPAAALLFIVSLMAMIGGVKRVLMPKVRPGFYSMNSSFYLRKWVIDNLAELSLQLLQAMYATLYLAPWLRVLGAKIGRRAEISTVAHITPDLLQIDDESFVADAACIGSTRVFQGRFMLAPTHIGQRSFLGNSAFIPGSTTLADGCLIGVLSLPPNMPTAADTTWLGSPPFYLPHRQPSDPFAEELTFTPTPRLFAIRLTFEFFRVLTPPTLWYLSVSLIFKLWLPVALHGSWLAATLLFPPLYGFASLMSTMAVVLLKWLLVGRYRPRVRPLWSHFVWRSELITGLYENITVPLLLGWLTGTPFAAWILRLYGTHIGHRVCMESTYLTEFDLVSIGDGAEIGPFSSLQTHLFEDRVMKMSKVEVGRACSVGARAVALYDSVMEEQSTLDALSLLMKGETLPARSHWWGIPARRYS